MATYLSAATVGELRRGVELMRHRGDDEQARLLEAWLADVVDQYADNILAFDAEAAQVWGRLALEAVRGNEGFWIRIGTIKIINGTAAAVSLRGWQNHET